MAPRASRRPLGQSIRKRYNTVSDWSTLRRFFLFIFLSSFIVSRSVSYVQIYHVPGTNTLQLVAVIVVNWHNFYTCYFDNNIPPCVFSEMLVRVKKKVWPFLAQLSCVKTSEEMCQFSRIAATRWKVSFLGPKSWQSVYIIQRSPGQFLHHREKLCSVLLCSVCTRSVVSPTVPH